METRFISRAEYIQENHEYYIAKFNKMEISGSKISMNWAAFLFTDAWMLYRRMYKQFIVVFILQWAINIFLPFINLLVRIAVGLFGNYIYMIHIDTLSEQGSAMTQPDKDIHRAKYGGTSRKAICFYLIISFILGIYSAVYTA